jgi:hypothetical protein
MNEERIITAAVVTTGEKSDGKQLQTLIEKSRKTGMEINTVIGDTAYSEKENIEYAKENGLQLVAKLNPNITQGVRKKEGIVKPIQLPSSRQNIKNKKHFKIVMNSKKKRKNVIKLRQKIVNSNIDTDMMMHLPRV